MKLGNLFGVILAWITLSAPSAYAFGWQGHQYIANLAYDLLNPAARKQVNVILGTNSAGKPIALADAAILPDCARDVSGPDSGPKAFHASKYTPKVCLPLAADNAVRGWMEDYASRNWTNCTYANKKSACHKAYHFVDVNVETHSDYGPDYFGTVT